MSGFLFAKSKPNEWLLDIHNGGLVKAGVGMRILRKPGHIYARLPSGINRVTFRAKQVSVEMQGLDMSGFIVWSIYRDDNGPFKALKFLDWNSANPCQSANENIARLAEAVTRTEIANSKISDLMTKREEVMEVLKQKILSVVSGWGIWIETVEITDVRISSERLFMDMQAPFREKAREEAEKIVMNTNKSIEESKISTKLEIHKRRTEASKIEGEASVEAETSKLLCLEEHKITRAKGEQQTYYEQLKFEKEREVMDFELKKQRILNQKNLEEVAEMGRLDLERARLELESQMSEISIQLRLISSFEKVMSEIPLKNVNLMQLGSSGTGRDGEDPISSFLTSILTSYRAADSAIKRNLTIGSAGNESFESSSAED